MSNRSGDRTPRSFGRAVAASAAAVLTALVGLSAAYGLATAGSGSIGAAVLAPGAVFLSGACFAAIAPAERFRVWLWLSAALALLGCLVFSVVWAAIGCSTEYFRAFLVCLPYAFGAMAAAAAGAAMVPPPGTRWRSAGIALAAVVGLGPFGWAGTELAQWEVHRRAELRWALKDLPGHVERALFTSASAARTRVLWEPVEEDNGSLMVRGALRPPGPGRSDRRDRVSGPVDSDSLGVNRIHVDFTPPGQIRCVFNVEAAVREPGDAHGRNTGLADLARLGVNPTLLKGLRENAPAKGGESRTWDGPAATVEFRSEPDGPLWSVTAWLEPPPM
jgi:hypothetical protein